jgi:hypothetical protein
MKSRYNKNGKLIELSWTMNIRTKIQKELDKKFLDDIYDVIVKGHIGNKQS